MERKQDLEAIKNIVCSYYKADKGSVYKYKGRKRQVLIVKHFTVYLSYTNSQIPIMPLSSYFGYTHSTLLHIVKKIDGYIQYDKSVAKEWCELQDKIEEKIKINPRER